MSHICALNRLPILRFNRDVFARHVQFLAVATDDTNSIIRVDPVRDTRFEDERKRRQVGIIGATCSPGTCVMDMMVSTSFPFKMFPTSLSSFPLSTLNQISQYFSSNVS